MNQQIFLILQIVLGIILTVLILLQAKGTGLGSTFGGDLSVYGTKRGAEKILFRLTMVVSFLFLASMLAGVVLG